MLTQESTVEVKAIQVSYWKIFLSLSFLHIHTHTHTHVSTQLLLNLSLTKYTAVGNASSKRYNYKIIQLRRKAFSKVETNGKDCCTTQNS